MEDAGSTRVTLEVQFYSLNTTVHGDRAQELLQSSARWIHKVDENTSLKLLRLLCPYIYVNVVATFGAGPINGIMASAREIIQIRITDDERISGALELAKLQQAIIALQNDGCLFLSYADYQVSLL